MKSRVRLSLLILFVSIIPGAAFHCFAQNKKTIDLLSKENAPKWRGYNSATLPPGWTISNGVLSLDPTIKSDGSYKGGQDVIFGGQEFGYFELTIEWKIAKGANSGIFYHVKEGYGSPSSLAPEYQLIDDVNYAQMHPDLKDYNAHFGAVHPALLQDWQKTGADYAMHPADETKKYYTPQANGTLPGL